jgi:uncharacterized protein YcbX
MTELSHIAVHPVKALDPASLDSVSITGIGGLAGDRAYGITDEHGEYVHGKRTQKVHRLDCEFDLERNCLRVQIEGHDSSHEFHLDDDRAALEAWLSDFFDFRVELTVGPGGSQTDSVVFTDSEEAGPTVVSEATIREVASWYDGIDPEEMRLRLRPNLVVTGVPPFWEEKLIADGGCRFQIGDVLMEGVGSVPRCVVPTRNPYTGEEYAGFRQTFVEKRDATLPEWTSRATLDGNLFSLTAVARIPESQRDGELRVGDSVRVVGPTAED